MDTAAATGLVLAAGAGSRMGTPKGELVVGGRRLVDRAVGALLDGGCEPVICVVRAGVDVAGAAVLVNPDPDRGLRSSLDLGVAAAREDAPVLVLLADLPGVGGAAVRATIAGWRPGRVAIARYGPIRGHPIMMSVARWQEALAQAGPDEGARTYLAGHRHLVDEVLVDGDPTDLDTPTDLRRWTGGAAHA